MRLRKRLVLYVAPLAIVLTGCFQQAGTALQEPIITNEAVSVPETLVPLPTDTVDDTGGVLNTPTFDLLPDDATPDNGNPPVALTIISATRPPLATETPILEIPTNVSGQTVDAQGTPVNSQFITPSGPLGPITQVPVEAATSAGEPTSTPSGLVTPTAFSSVETGGACTHTVQSGDTLYRIAIKYGVTLTQLRQVNPQVTGDIIQPGDTLQVPDCDTAGGSNNVEQPAGAPTTIPTALPGGSQTYVVKRGDTLYSISLQFGVTSAAIQQANNIANPDRISPGQELIIPPKSG